MRAVVAEWFLPIRNQLQDGKRRAIPASQTRRQNVCVQYDPLHKAK